MCDAIIPDPNNVLYRASMQRITSLGKKNCSRKSIETVGHLSLCKVHARLAREGLVARDGTVAESADIQIVRRYPQKYPHGLFKWLMEVDPNKPGA